jgi:hypothetical protein
MLPSVFYNILTQRLTHRDVVINNISWAAQHRKEEHLLTLQSSLEPVNLTAKVCITVKQDKKA